MTKKSVLFLMYHLLDGGAEKALINTLDYIDYSKYDVDLIVLAKEQADLYNINENVNVKYMYENAQLLNQDNSAGKFKLHLDKEYDIEVAYFGMLTVWAIARFGNPKAKKIAWLHSDIRLTIGSSTPEYINNLFGDIDSIICVSEGAKQSFINFAGRKLEKKLEVVLNPIDVDQIQDLSLQEVDYKKDKFTILSIGRLTRGKGFERLISIHKILLNEGIENDLIILGSGEDEERIKNIIKSLHLEESCKLIPYQKNPYPFIEMCDLFVSSSYSEGLSLVIIEAMILKKPIVATNTYGPQVLFKDKFGLMVENDEKSLYYGIKDMIINHDKRQKYIDNLSSVQRFEFDRYVIMPKIEDIFNKQKLEISQKNDVRVLTQKSNFYFEQQNYSKSREMLYNTFEIEFPKVDIIYKIALSFEIEKDYENAIKWYKSIFNLDISNEDKRTIEQGYNTWRPHLQLTVCYYELREIEKSLYHHNKAYEINPMNEAIVQNEEFFKNIKLK